MTLTGKEAEELRALYARRDSISRERDAMERQIQELRKKCRALSLNMADINKAIQRARAARLKYEPCKFCNKRHSFLVDCPKPRKD